MLIRLSKSQLLFGFLPEGFCWWSAGIAASLIVLWFALNCGSLGCSDFFLLPPDIREMRLARVLSSFCVGALYHLPVH